MSKIPQPLHAARPFFPAALIVGAVLLAYAPVFRAGFIWDDNHFLTANRLIRASNGLYRFWFTAAPSDYFPLTSSLLWCEWRLWGMNATGYHAVNLLLHAAGAALLWRVLLKLRVPGAWLAGLLFALHPVAVASAAWISEGKNTLSMVLCLGSLLAYLRFDEQKNARGYALSIALFLLALLAKSSVVMLPVVLLLLGWWRRGRVEKADVLKTAPFFALSLALGLVTIWFQWHNAIGQEVVRAEGAASRIAAAGWIAWFYLYKILLPAGLCAVYPRWEVDGSSVVAFLPIALLGAATALLWAGRKRWGAGPLVAWACFLVLLLPVLGFVTMSFMRLSLVADHLEYVAMPPILALAAALLTRATSGTRGGWLAKASVGICLVALAALTFQRAGVFSSDERLWGDNVSKTPGSARVWCEWGMAYVHAGALDEAIVTFDRALELDPRYFHGWLDRGIARADAHRYAQAIRDYDQAIALKPDLPDAWYNRSNAWFSLGRPDEALRDLDQAIALRPDYVEAYVNRGVIHAAAGDSAAALHDYDQAIAVNPDCVQAYVNRGLIQAAAGHSAEALSDYDQAIALQPDCVEAWYNRGTAHARAGRLEEAMYDLDEAIRLKPDYVEAYVNRGNVYLAAHHYAEAIADYSQAIACNPRYADAWYNRGNAELAADRPQEAIRDWQPGDRAAAAGRPRVFPARPRPSATEARRRSARGSRTRPPIGRVGARGSPSFPETFREAAALIRGKTSSALTGWKEPVS